MIPCANPKASYEAHQAEINNAIARVLANGRYILGEEVAAFEREFAAYVGTRHAVGVASGTDALKLALCAYEIGAGDEVITVAHTAVATVAAIVEVGALPVLVDIEKDSFTISPAAVAAAVTSKTKAIIAVHLYGQPAALTSLRKIAARHHVVLIEDAAQAAGATYHGKPVGSMGEVGCFSFYPTKNLGAIGDGGMVVTNDEHIAARVKLLRQYGWTKRYVSYIHGWNSRLDEIQAAILRVKLRYLAEDNDTRRNQANQYSHDLQQLPVVLPQTIPQTQSAWHLYVIRVARRDDCQRFLMERGIQTLIHYPVPIHVQPAYRDRVRLPGSLAVTEKIAQEILSLPLYPGLTADQRQIVVSSIREFAQVETAEKIRA